MVIADTSLPELRIPEWQMEYTVMCLNFFVLSVRTGEGRGFLPDRTVVKQC
jgi:hypothetical protein